MTTKRFNVRHHKMVALCLTALLLVGGLAGRAPVPGPAQSAPPAHPLVDQQHAATALANLGLSFEANKGQTNPAVRYLARGSGYTIFLTDKEAVLVASTAGATAGAPVQHQVLRYQAQGAADVHPVAQQELPGKINYYIGNDAAKWTTDIATYSRVSYPNLYPGVDLVYYGSKQALEYDFVVAAGADPNAIHLSIAGADKMALDGSDLVLTTAQGTLRQPAPHVYQDGPGGRQTISGSYTLRADHTVGFALGRYDAGRPVVIDPLVWSTYLGSSAINRTGDGGDWGVGIRNDSSNNPIIAGVTDGTDYPETTIYPSTGTVDFFTGIVTKMKSDGSALLWSDVIGGSSGNYRTPDYRTHFHGVDVDTSGNVYVAGFTNDSTYPTTVGAYNRTIDAGGPHPGGGVGYDAVVGKLNGSTGAVIYSTFLGGGGEDFGYDVAVDGDNNAWVFGGTNSCGTGNGGCTRPYPTTATRFSATNRGGYDAFVAGLSATGQSLLYSTLLGGTQDEMLPLGEATYEDTRFTDAPQDAFYREGGVKVTGSFTSTNNARIFVAGYTKSSSGDANQFPVTGSAYQNDLGGGDTADAFFTKINPKAAALVYSTYFGNNGVTRASDLALDSAGNAYITGYTEGIPTTGSAYNTNYSGTGDAFVAKFDPTQSGNASFIYGTYLGTAQFDRGYGIYVDQLGQAAVAGATLATGANFPTTAGALQTTNQGGQDGFVTAFNAAGSALIYSTYLGGTGDEWASGMTVDHLGAVIVTGATTSTDSSFPHTAGAYKQAYQGGKMDAFVTKFTVTAPTAVQVSGLAAAPAPDGGVDVQWTSATEFDHLGFHLLRGPSAAGPFKAVTDRLISQWANPSGGGLYRYHDPAGAKGAWYQLVAVDTHNGTQAFTPVAVGATLPAVVAAPSRDQQAAQAAVWAAANALALAQLPHPPLTVAPYKLMISQSGVARVTYDQLAAAGVPLQGVNPDHLTLTTGLAGSRTEVPLVQHNATAGVFAPGDSFDFVAQAAPSPDGTARAYYLALGPAAGLRMPRASGAATGAAPATYVGRLHLEENHYYWYYWHASLGKAQPEGPWYWDYALNNQDSSTTLTVANVDTTQPGSITINYQGFTDDPAVPLNHHTQVFLNNSLLGDVQWGGMAPRSLTAPLPAGLLLSGANTLRLHNVGDTGESYEGVWLTSADVTVPRFYHAANDSLTFPATGGTNIAVDGFRGTDIALYDVTTPEAPQLLKAQVTNGLLFNTLRAAVPGVGLRQLQAVTTRGLVAPDSIAPVSTQDLHQGSADYLVIAYDGMLAAANQLAALHANEGMRTAVVPASAIYDQFGSGAPAPAALAAFLAATGRQWSAAPHYVALLGSASNDGNNYLGAGYTDLLPTAYVDTSYMGQTASDSSLLVAAGSDVPANGIALGRLPAHSPAEANALVAKIVGYSSTAHQWAAQAGLVSDAAEAGLFDDASDHLAGALGTARVQRIYESQYGGQTGTQIVNSLNAGLALLNYYGHSSYTYWSQDQIFSTASVAQLNNAGRETFVTSMTCYTGNYAWADGTALVNALVLKATGGAIGGLGGTAISTPEGQQRLTEAFYRNVQAGQRIGDALVNADAVTADREVVVEFQLVGDPALRIDLGNTGRTKGGYR